MRDFAAAITAPFAQGKTFIMLLWLISGYYLKCLGQHVELNVIYVTEKF